jgi:excisionase family DNA binding protein
MLLTRKEAMGEKQMARTLGGMTTEGHTNLNQLQEPGPNADTRGGCFLPELEVVTTGLAPADPATLIRVASGAVDSTPLGANRTNSSEKGPGCRSAKSPPIGLSESAASAGSDHNHQRLANLPMTVKDAARFLGVSPQTVYLWVERKQIPHLRVMGRNIRFLISDLEPFRAQFKQEVEDGETKQA